MVPIAITPGTVLVIAILAVLAIFAVHRLRTRGLCDSGCCDKATSSCGASGCAACSGCDAVENMLADAERAAQEEGAVQVK